VKFTASEKKVMADLMQSDTFKQQLDFMVKQRVLDHVAEMIESTAVTLSKYDRSKRIVSACHEAAAIIADAANDDEPAEAMRREAHDELEAEAVAA